MITRWQLVSLLGSVDELRDVFRHSLWNLDALEIADGFAPAVDAGDRGFLDQRVPLEMAVFGLAVLGVVVFRGADGWLRTNPAHGGSPVPLCWVLLRYGGDVAEELLEKASIREPAGPLPAG